MRTLLALLVAMVVAFGCGGSYVPPSAPSPILNKALPKFKRRTMSGSSVTTKEPTGQVVVVKFFAKYCKPCKKSLPAAERLHKANGDITFIGVAEDEYQADVEEMINTYGLTFAVVHDRGNVLSGRFRVSQLPITFVADPGGTICWVGGEQATEDDLEAAIEWARNRSSK